MPDVIETADAAASTGTTYTIGVGQTLRGTLNANGDHDWYRVNLVAGQTYTIAMVGTGANNVINPFLSLYGPDGSTLMASNDDGLQGNNSVFTFTATATGSFYIDAAAFANSGSGQYGISVTSGTRASFDAEMGAGVIDTDLAWTATPGTPVTVTVAFRLTDDGAEAGFSQFTPAQIAAMQSIMQFYSEVCGLTFNVVPGYSDNATILLSNYNFDDQSGGYAYYPGSTASNAVEGDVHINLFYNSNSDLSTGTYSYSTLLHEFGHAVGLSHPGLYNAGPGQTLSYATHAQFTQDTNQYSVMSYWDESNTGASDYAEYPDTMMLFDVLALQSMYGMNMNTRTGSSVYGFNSNVGGVYNFATNITPAICIWDAGGADAFDLSGYSMSQVLSLVDGTFSNIGGGIGNVSIAVGAIIENALGGTGADTITGNASNNLIAGNGGNDIIRGGAGSDTLLGQVGADSLYGEAGADAIYFDNQDLVVDGGVDGGAFFDWAIAFNSTGVNVNLGSQHFEGVSGSNSADIINASTATWSVTIVGQGGSDQLTGGSAGDALYFDEFDSVINGGGGFDWAIAYQSNGFSLTLNAARSIEGVAGSEFNDTINASTMTTAVTLVGLGGADTLIGGSGADALYFDSLDTVTGGGGFDWAFAMGTAGVTLNMAAAGIEGATGTSGNDVFNAAGSAGGVIILGGDGNDTFFNGAHADQIDGGAGATDTINYTGFNSGAATITPLGGGVFQITIGGVMDTISGVEVLHFDNGNVLL